MTAGVLSGIVLAWVIAPLLSSGHTARARIAVIWPRLGASRTPDRAEVDRFFKELTEGASDWAGTVMRTYGKPSSTPHYRSMKFSRPYGRDDELAIAFTCEDKELSQTVVKEMVAHMAESATTGPTVRVIEPTSLDVFPAPPTLPVSAAGAAFGLIAGLIIARSLPPRGKPEPADEARWK